MAPRKGAKKGIKAGKQTDNKNGKHRQPTPAGAAQTQAQAQVQAQAQIEAQVQAQARSRALDFHAQDHLVRARGAVGNMNKRRRKTKSRIPPVVRRCLERAQPYLRHARFYLAVMAELFVLVFWWCVALEITGLVKTTRFVLNLCFGIGWLMYYCPGWRLFLDSDTPVDGFLLRVRANVERKAEDMNLFGILFAHFFLDLVMSYRNWARLAFGDNPPDLV
jgi:hypothetical protein